METCNYNFYLPLPGVAFKTSSPSTILSNLLINRQVENSDIVSFSIPGLIPFSGIIIFPITICILRNRFKFNFKSYKNTLVFSIISIINISILALVFVYAYDFFLAIEKTLCDTQVFLIDTYEKIQIFTSTIDALDCDIDINQIKDTLQIFDPNEYTDIIKSVYDYLSKYYVLLFVLCKVSSV